MFGGGPRTQTSVVCANAEVEPPAGSAPSPRPRRLIVARRAEGRCTRSRSRGASAPPRAERWPQARVPAGPGRPTQRPVPESSAPYPSASPWRRMGTRPPDRACHRHQGRSAVCAGRCGSTAPCPKTPCAVVVPAYPRRSGPRSRTRSTRGRAALPSLDTTGLAHPPHERLLDFRPPGATAGLKGCRRSPRPQSMGRTPLGPREDTRPPRRYGLPGGLHIASGLRSPQDGTHSDHPAIDSPVSCGPLHTYSGFHLDVGCLCMRSASPPRETLG